jgi:hypothetical protein
MAISEQFDLSTIVELVTRLVAFVAIVWFAASLSGHWAPKLAPTAPGSDGNRSQLSCGASKKKGSRTKKNRKGRSALQGKLTHSVDTFSEEELDTAHAQNASDVEAPSMPSPAITFKATPFGADTFEPLLGRTLSNAQTSNAGTGVDNNDSDSEDLEMCAADTALIAEGIHSSKTIQEEYHSACQSCPSSDISSWGCPEQRIYTSSLLLMHREIQRVIAQGAPGLEPPATTAITGSSLRSVRMS